jgi:hypothetical protein
MRIIYIYIYIYVFIFINIKRLDQRTCYTRMCYSACAVMVSIKPLCFRFIFCELLVLVRNSALLCRGRTLISRWFIIQHFDLLFSLSVHPCPRVSIFSSERASIPALSHVACILTRLMSSWPRCVQRVALCYRPGNSPCLCPRPTTGSDFL